MRISMLHVVFLSMTVIGLKNHVTIIPPLLMVSGRDGWLSVLLTTIILIPWLFIIVFIHKNTQQEDMRLVLRNTLGRTWYTIFLIIFGSLMILFAAFTMREAVQWISTTFLFETPVLALLIVYIVLCLLLASAGLTTLAMVNVVVLFGVVVFGFFVAFANLQVKDFTLLLPFLEHGMKPVAKGFVYPAAAMTELILFVFIQQKMKTKAKFYQYLIMLGLLMWLTLGPLIGAIIEFGPTEAATQRFPAYEEWTLVTIGRFIERMDFLSIYQWLTGGAVRIAFFMFILMHMLKITKKKKIIWLILMPIFLALTLTFTFMDDQLYLRLKRDVALPLSFSFYFTLSIFLLIISLIAKKSKGSVTS